MNRYTPLLKIEFFIYFIIIIIIIFFFISPLCLDQILFVNFIYFSPEKKNYTCLEGMCK